MSVTSPCAPANPAGRLPHVTHDFDPLPGEEVAITAAWAQLIAGQLEREGRAA